MTLYDFLMSYTCPLHLALKVRFGWFQIWYRSNSFQTMVYPNAPHNLIIIQLFIVKDNILNIYSFILCRKRWFYIYGLVIKIIVFWETTQNNFSFKAFSFEILVKSDFFLENKWLFLRMRTFKSGYFI
jgi:hypothetical protein